MGVGDAVGSWRSPSGCAVPDVVGGRVGSAVVVMKDTTTDGVGVMIDTDGVGVDVTVLVGVAVGFAVTVRVVVTVGPGADTVTVGAVNVTAGSVCVDTIPDGCAEGSGLGVVGFPHAGMAIAHARARVAASAAPPRCTARMNVTSTYRGSLRDRYDLFGHGSITLRDRD